jgi:NAD(P)-dependent dehydrogenase (short-subunit alcohol dehydrogenase family)
VNIFITGGTTGIGLALAKLYLSEGHRVGICGRDLSKLTEEYPNLFCYKVDVTNRDELHAAVKEFSKGELDIIIANAGRSVGAKTQIPNAILSSQVIDINVKGVLNTFDIGLELMLHKRKGHLVATASVAGFVGLPGAAAYSASKAAVLKLCESYAIDFKPLGISVTAIAPGFIDTPLTKQNPHSMPFIMSAEKGAMLIKRAIEKKKVLYIFPLPMKIIITILDKMPRCLYRFIMSIKFFNYSQKIGELQ